MQDLANGMGQDNSSAIVIPIPSIAETEKLLHLELSCQNFWTRLHVPGTDASNDSVFTITAQR